LDDPRISGEHASLHWMGDRWDLRDLGSRNGTFVGDRRLLAGERLMLTAGMMFTLGRSEVRFTLVDSGPPAALARNTRSGLTRASVGDLLVLPDDDNPSVSLFRDANFQWVVESGEEKRPVAHQEILHIGEDRWELGLPNALIETWEANSAPLDSIHLRIGVSRNEEHVEVTVIHAAQTRTLPARTYHYLLATLGREWLKDADTPKSERGWVDRDLLCQMMGTDANRLNVEIHRVRRQLSELGIQGAADIIQRRSDTRQIRIGIESIEVFTL
jgi:hypothetical protein